MNREELLHELYESIHRQVQQIEDGTSSDDKCAEKKLVDSIYTCFKIDQIKVVLETSEVTDQHININITTTENTNEQKN